MEIITIKVDSDIAKAYREAETKQQENVTKICSLILKQLLKPASFRETVDQIRQETKANGLTPEILAELLEDE